MRYIEFDNEGNILKTGVCSQQEFVRRVTEGVSIMKGEVGIKDTTHKVVDNEVVLK